METRLVSPLPTGPPVLLPPAGSPPKWGPRSQFWLSQLQYKTTTSVCVCVCLCVCVCVCSLSLAYRPYPSMHVITIAQWQSIFALKKASGSDRNAGRIANSQKLVSREPPLAHD